MISLQRLVEAARQVAATRARHAKRAALAALLREAQRDDLEIAVAFLCGRTRHAPLGVGHALLRSVGRIAPVESPRLTLAEADAVFAQVASCTGVGAAARRRDLLAGLLARATATEQDFLRRLIAGALRQGALDGVMLEAVAQAAGVDPDCVHRGIMFEPDLGRLARIALQGGRQALQALSVRPQHPVPPMLAQAAADLEQALGGGPVALEHKLDGARVQVHRLGDQVRVFTRQLNDVTAAVPEIVEATRALSADSLILDGEAIALDARGRPLPFQITIRRFGRRAQVAPLRAALPLSVFFFDCLYLDGMPLLDRPYAERIDALAALVPPSLRMPRVVTADAAEARAFYEAALAHGCEGVMVKDLAAPYQAGLRGAAWRKVKRAQTLDLVVLASEWGSGRRQGFLSNLHLGARDPATGGFVMLGKTFKGLTDELLAWQTDALLARAVAREGRVVHVRPELVVEIAFEGLQMSPHYPAALALRFARVRRYRPDKHAAEADTIDTVRALAAARAPR
ncbi:MAG: ATP-dependent DNA ligase [Sutterellaceae bacterium]|nr:ATP-dependent DNA ligase [Burkholderiaceae bacterium]MDW8429921.1 ATP-dependent DNA ligase [Sutterellaceae bacterium]